MPVEDDDSDSSGRGIHAATCMAAICAIRSASLARFWTALSARCRSRYCMTSRVPVALQKARVRLCGTPCSRHLWTPCLDTPMRLPISSYVRPDSWTLTRNASRSLAHRRRTSSAAGLADATASIRLGSRVVISFLPSSTFVNQPFWAKKRACPFGQAPCNYFSRTARTSSRWCAYAATGLPCAAWAIRSCIGWLADMRDMSGRARLRGCWAEYVGTEVVNGPSPGRGQFNGPTNFAREPPALDPAGNFLRELPASTRKLGLGRRVERLGNGQDYVHAGQ